MNTPHHTPHQFDPHREPIREPYHPYRRHDRDFIGPIAVTVVLLAGLAFFAFFPGDHRVRGLATSGEDQAMAAAHASDHLYGTTNAVVSGDIE